MNLRSSRFLRSVFHAFILTAALAAPAVAGPIQGVSPDEHLDQVRARFASGLPVKVIAFGSSSTQGVGASSPAAAYPSRLGVDLAALWPSHPVSVLNRGIGGEDADDMAVRLPSVIAEHPDLILWQTGSNDPLRNVPLDRFEVETIAGIQAIRAAHINVMLIEPQFCRTLNGKAGSDIYRETLRAIAAGMDVPVIRRYDLMRTWLEDGELTAAQLLSPDGLHMADGGYAKLAEAIAFDIRHRLQPARTAMISTPHSAR